jgi:hypothetical protein
LSAVRRPTHLPEPRGCPGPLACSPR